MVESAATAVEHFSGYFINHNSCFILDLSFLCVCFQTNIFYIHGSVSELSSIINLLLIIIGKFEILFNAQ